MSSSKWLLPADTDTVLYISAESSMAFGSIFEKMVDHFGDEIRFDQFTIEAIRFAHEEPCSCCRGSGEFSLYLQITKNNDLVTDTTNMKVRVLTELAEIKR